MEKSFSAMADLRDSGRVSRIWEYAGHVVMTCSSFSRIVSGNGRWSSSRRFGSSQQNLQNLGWLDCEYLEVSILRSWALTVRFGDYRKLLEVHFGVLGL